jgi:hypothetical protein
MDRFLYVPRKEKISEPLSYWTLLAVKLRMIFTSKNAHLVSPFSVGRAETVEFDLEFLMHSGKCIWNRCVLGRFTRVPDSQEIFIVPPAYAALEREGIPKSMPSQSPHIPAFQNIRKISFCLLWICFKITPDFSS